MVIEDFFFFFFKWKKKTKEKTNKNISTCIYNCKAMFNCQSSYLVILGFQAFEVFSIWYLRI